MSVLDSSCLSALNEFEDGPSRYAGCFKLTQLTPLSCNSAHTVEHDSLKSVSGLKTRERWNPKGPP